MKKIVLLSKETVYSGCMLTSVFEITDCLANCLNKDYEVTIICQKNSGCLAEKVKRLKEIQPGVYRTKILKVVYYLLDSDKWDFSQSIIHDIQPDILHIFSEPEEILKYTSLKAKKFYTFDNCEKILDKEDYLKCYDRINSTSKISLQEILQRATPKLIDILQSKKARSIQNGILGWLFDPSNGAGLMHPYSKKDLSGKEKAKKKICHSNNLSTDQPLFFSGSLIENYDLSKVLEAIEGNKDIKLFLIGKPNLSTIERIKTMKESGHQIFYSARPVPLIQIPKLIAGMDYFISPDIEEMGSFLTLMSCIYGIIPLITSKDKKTFDEFDDSQAIKCENFTDGFVQAYQLFQQKDLYERKQQNCMSIDRKWENVKDEYIRFYENLEE